MPLTREQRDDRIAYLSNKAEADGKELSIETFVDCLFDNWDDVINPALMANVSKRRQLKGLEDQKAAEDSARANVESEITRLRGELSGP